MEVSLGKSEKTPWLCFPFFSQGMVQLSNRLPPSSTADSLHPWITCHGIRGGALQTRRVASGCWPSTCLQWNWMELLPYTYLKYIINELWAHIQEGWYSQIDLVVQGFRSICHWYHSKKIYNHHISISEVLSFEQTISINQGNYAGMQIYEELQLWLSEIWGMLWLYVVWDVSSDGFLGSLCSIELLCWLPGIRQLLLGQGTTQCHGLSRTMHRIVRWRLISKKTRRLSGKLPAKASWLMLQLSIWVFSALGRAKLFKSSFSLLNAQDPFFRVMFALDSIWDPEGSLKTVPCKKVQKVIGCKISTA